MVKQGRVFKTRSGYAVSRRQFLSVLAGFGGSAVLHAALGRWGLSGPAQAQTPRFGEGNLGQGKKVIVIGAGVAGLCTGYLLSRRGFEVQIFEAGSRMGGRSLTVRAGDQFREDGGPVQTCTFEKTQGNTPYLNAGAGRIPHHHQTVLKYCRQLNVALEPFIFLSSANRFQSNTFNGGKPVLFRQLQSSLHHEIAEILAKTPGTELDNALDQVLSEDDFVQMFISDSAFGSLSPEEQRQILRGVFAGNFGDYLGGLPSQPAPLAHLREGFLADSSRFGSDFTDQLPAWAGLNGGNPLPLIELEEIIRSMMWHGEMFNSLSFEWQNSLLQPVGGMDMLWRGFLTQAAGHNRTVQDLVKLNRPVTAVEASDRGVTVRYPEGSESADFCVSTMTPRQLSRVLVNASADYKTCLSAFASVPATKVGWQTKDRFWEVGDGDIYETGRETIYGGISWVKADWPSAVTEAFKQQQETGNALTDDDFRRLYSQADGATKANQWSTLISQIWYPSSEFHSQTGVLTATYNNSRSAQVFGALDRADRISLALQGGNKLHSDYSEHIRVDTALTVAWHHMPYFDGGWDNHSARRSESRPYYEFLNTRYNPHLNVYLAGDYMSHLPGWQEGSLGSAEVVCDLICDRVTTG